MRATLDQFLADNPEVYLLHCDMWGFPLAPNVSVTPEVPRILPSCSKTISTLLVPSPIYTSEEVSPISISPPALVILRLPLESVSIFASTFPEESLNSCLLRF